MSDTFPTSEAAIYAARLAGYLVDVRPLSNRRAIVTCRVAGEPRRQLRTVPGGYRWHLQP